MKQVMDSIVFTAAGYGAIKDEIKEGGYTRFRLRLSQAYWEVLVSTIHHHAYYDEDEVSYDERVGFVK